jgi:hypothetical protein
VLKVSAEAHPVVIIRTSEHHVLSRPRLSVRMFGSWGKKRANASSNCASAAIFVPFRIWMGEKLLHHLLRCDFRAVLGEHRPQGCKQTSRREKAP